LGGRLFIWLSRIEERSSRKGAAMSINQEFFEKIEAFKNFSEGQQAKVKNLCEEVVFN